MRTGKPAGRSSTRSNSSASATKARASTRCCPASWTWSPRSTRARCSGSAIRPGHAIFETKAGLYTDLVMRRENGPGSNPDFVLAMKYLFDREQMKKTITLGHSVVANDQPIDPTNRFYFAGLPQRPFDLDKAKFHLQKANLGSAPLPVVASPAATYSVEMALVLQQTAAKIGLNLDLKRMPADGYWANHWMKSPINFGSVNPRPSADTLFTQFFKSDAPWNEAAGRTRSSTSCWSPRVARPTSQSATKMYADMQVMVSEGGGIGHPLFLSNIDGPREEAQGPVADTAGRPDGLHDCRARMGGRMKNGDRPRFSGNPGRTTFFGETRVCPRFSGELR
jgi:hypothetical protein